MHRRAAGPILREAGTGLTGPAIILIISRAVFKPIFCKGTEMAKIGARAVRAAVSGAGARAAGKAPPRCASSPTRARLGLDHRPAAPGDPSRAAMPTARSCRPSASWPRPSAPRAPRCAPRSTSSRRSGWSRAGSAAGTFVNFAPPRDAEDVAELTSPLELIEVRLALEPHMARLAVLNATARDIDRLAEPIDAMERRSATPRASPCWTSSSTCGSPNAPAIPLMVCALSADQRGARARAVERDEGQGADAERIAEYNQQHRSSYEAIRSRDVEGAVAIVTNHLHYARRQLLGAGSE